MTDYTTALFWAISGIGYGKGFTAEEAEANYVTAQLRNYRAKDTIYGTGPKFRAALESGDLRPSIWQAPEGTTGFFSDGQIHWTRGDGDRRGSLAMEEHLVRRHDG